MCLCCLGVDFSHKYSIKVKSVDLHKLHEAYRSRLLHLQEVKQLLVLFMHSTVHFNVAVSSYHRYIMFSTQYVCYYGH